MNTDTSWDAPVNSSHQLPAVLTNHKAVRQDWGWGQGFSCMSEYWLEFKTELEWVFYSTPNYTSSFAPHTHAAFCWRKERRTLALALALPLTLAASWTLWVYLFWLLIYNAFQLGMCQYSGARYITIFNVHIQNQRWSLSKYQPQDKFEDREDNPVILFIGQEFHKSGVENKAYRIYRSDFVANIAQNCGIVLKHQKEFQMSRTSTLFQGFWTSWDIFQEWLTY